MNTTLARWYLAAVPFLALVLAFAVGHVSWLIYLPCWLVNVLLMVLALRALHTGVAKPLRLFAWMIVVPWAAFTIFAGMGRPPLTVQGWADTATEQEIRFAILIAGSIVITLGLSVLGQALRAAGAPLYGKLATVAALLAAPLFILDMAFWGSTLPLAMQHFVESGAPGARPDWWVPLRYLFFEIASVAALLFYLAALFFAAALAQVGWMTSATARWYVGISIVAMVFAILPPNVPAPFDVPSYFFSIPAIGFLLFYYMALHLLWKKPATGAGLVV